MHLIFILLRFQSCTIFVIVTTSLALGSVIRSPLQFLSSSVLQSLNCWKLDCFLLIDFFAGLVDSPGDGLLLVEISELLHFHCAPDRKAFSFIFYFSSFLQAQSNSLTFMFIIVSIIHSIFFPFDISPAFLAVANSQSISSILLSTWPLHYSGPRRPRLQ